VIFFVCEFSIEFKVLFILKFCSKIWAYCNVLRLTVNMRLSASSVPAEQVELLILASGYSQLETTTTLQTRMLK
jgi:hypothetical protein